MVGPQLLRSTSIVSTKAKPYIERSSRRRRVALHTTQRSEKQNVPPVEHALKGECT